MDWGSARRKRASSWPGRRSGGDPGAVHGGGGARIIFSGPALGGTAATGGRGLLEPSFPKPQCAFWALLPHPCLDEDFFIDKMLMSFHDYHIIPSRFVNKRTYPQFKNAKIWLYRAIKLASKENINMVEYSYNDYFISRSRIS